MAAAGQGAGSRGSQAGAGGRGTAESREGNGRRGQTSVPDLTRWSVGAVGLHDSPRSLVLLVLYSENTLCERRLMGGGDDRSLKP